MVRLGSFRVSGSDKVAYSELTVYKRKMPRPRAGCGLYFSVGGVINPLCLTPDNS